MSSNVSLEYFDNEKSKIGAVKSGTYTSSTKNLVLTNNDDTTTTTSLSNLSDKTQTETVSGYWTFSTIPNVSNAYFTMVDTKEYAPFAVTSGTWYTIASNNSTLYPNNMSQFRLQAYFYSNSNAGTSLLTVDFDLSRAGGYALVPQMAQGNLTTIGTAGIVNGARAVVIGNTTYIQVSFNANYTISTSACTISTQNNMPFTNDAYKFKVVNPTTTSGTIAVLLDILPSLNQINNGVSTKSSVWEYTAGSGITLSGTYGTVINATAGGSGISADGGVYITLTNQTGAASVKGTVVDVSSTVDNAFVVSPVSSQNPIGVVLESGIANGSPVKVAVSGKAYVLLKDGNAGTRASWCGVSPDVPGRIRQYPAPPSSSSSLHFTEVGHSLENVTAGTNKLCLVNLHFN